jgi:hypothetical protein
MNRLMMIAILAALSFLIVGKAHSQIGDQTNLAAIVLPAKLDPANNPSLAIACRSLANDVSGGVGQELLLIYPNSVGIRDNRGVKLAWVTLKFASGAPLWNPSGVRGIDEWNKITKGDMKDVYVVGLGNPQFNMSRVLGSRSSFAVEWEPAKAGDKYPEKRTTEFDMKGLTDEVLKRFKAVCEGKMPPRQQ